MALTQTPANAALRAALKVGRRANKFGAVSTKRDGYRFDSLKEARRHDQLKLLERAGEISGLRVHPRYVLWAATFGTEIGKTKACEYEGDFEYVDGRTGLVVTEDVKSEATRTELYKLKRKMFAANYGREIVEV